MNEALAEQSKRPRKRRWARVLGIFLLLLLANGLWQGLRYPPLQYDPTPHPQSTEFSNQSGNLKVNANQAFLRKDTGKHFVYRAFGPEPDFLFVAESTGWTGEVVIENIHPQSDLQLANGVTASRVGLELRLKFTLGANQNCAVAVKMPKSITTKFAVIGDGGGRGEMAWCFKRAADLGAQFILHLGDIAYIDADFDSGAKIWNQSPIPIYTAVGNHDFHGGHRYRFKFFMKHFAPLNSAFNLNGLWFLSLDTAADTVPAWGGERGDLLEWFEELPKEQREQVIVYTHKPLLDPRVMLGQRKEKGAHALNRSGEANWLRAKAKELGVNAWLCGHIHHSFDFSDQGLHTIIAGEGLGANGDSARILLGEFRAQQSPDFSWAQLNMPADAHGWGLTPPDNISWWPLD